MRNYSCERCIKLLEEIKLNNTNFISKIDYIIDVLRCEILKNKSRNNGSKLTGLRRKNDIKNNEQMLPLQ